MSPTSGMRGRAVCRFDVACRVLLLVATTGIGTIAGCTSGPDAAYPARAPDTTASEPEATIPPGILAAVPFQNRLDVPQGILQLKLYNGTNMSLSVVGVQFVWEGLTTQISYRSNPLAAGDRIDFPAPLAAAQCVGAGTLDEMPDLSAAVVHVFLADGRSIDAPAFDVKHFARTLYLEDCERQHIAREIGIEWTNLHETEIDGRPVTEGVLRLSRRAAPPDRAISVLFVSNTIIFTVVQPQGRAGVVAVLAPETASIDVPIRFVEGRCDAHARSEASQPFQFIAQIDLGDGLVRPYSLPPATSDQPAMREVVERACTIIGTTGFAGQDDPTSSSAP